MKPAKVIKNGSPGDPFTGDIVTDDNTLFETMMSNESTEIDTEPIGKLNGKNINVGEIIIDATPGVSGPIQNLIDSLGETDSHLVLNTETIHMSPNPVVLTDPASSTVFNMIVRLRSDPDKLALVNFVTEMNIHS